MIEPKIRMSISVPVSKYVAIQNLSEAQKDSMNACVNIMIDEFLETHDLKCLSFIEIMKKEAYEQAKKDLREEITKEVRAELNQLTLF